MRNKIKHKTFAGSILQAFTSPPATRFASFWPSIFSSIQKTAKITSGIPFARPNDPLNILQASLWQAQSAC